MPHHRSGRFGEPGERRPDAPFPWEQVRDMLGICRALYAARMADTDNADARGSLRLLAEIGKQLADALELGRGARPFTKRHHKAWELAEEAVARLGWQLSREETLRPTFDAAGKRILGHKPYGPEQVPDKIKHG